MKFSKKRNQYESSNVTFNVDKMDARSYNWWQFVAKINGKVVFNDHRYSNSTAKHLYKVKKLLKDLGVEIDLVVNTRLGLQDSNWSQDTIKCLISEKVDIKLILENNRRKKSLDAERMARMIEIDYKINEIITLTNMTAIDVFHLN